MRRKRLRIVPVYVALAVGLGLALWWCWAGTSPTVAEGLATRGRRTPVVFVPGVTGVSLLEADSGRAVWGTGKTLIQPHDRGYGAARSLVLGGQRPTIVPGQVITDLRLFGLLRIEVYQTLIDLFVANGYQQGDLEDPAPNEDFFLFAYDWRADNVESAARLAEGLETLRQRRGDERMLVNLVCQSNGAHVCRYFAKYRGLSLEAVDSGGAPSDDRLAVDRLILVGSSNGGSIRVLRELDHGRRYIRAIGRLFSPETLFTFASLFQDLPVYTDDLFVDTEGSPMAVDLFDADNWQRFGWSIYASGIQKHLQRADLPWWFGSSEDRRDYLVRSLRRARRFHAALGREAVGFGSTRAYLIENDQNETSSRAVLRRHGEGWQTLFGDDSFVRHNPALRRAVVEAGDGHATTTSQNWLSLQEVRQLERRNVGSTTSHRKIILLPETHRMLIELLGTDDDSAG